VLVQASSLHRRAEALAITAPPPFALERRPVRHSAGQTLRGSILFQPAIRAAKRMLLSPRKEPFMNLRAKQDTALTRQLVETSTLQSVETSDLTRVEGGIWDYSNRLGMLGQMLEDRQDRKYGVSFDPKTIDAAAGQALQGWVSIP
jgi:hypothetical protein